MKMLFKILIILILTPTLLLAGILVWTLVSGNIIFIKNMANADQRLLDLKESYESSQSMNSSDDSFVDWNGYDPSEVKYNQLQMIGSHNSYKNELVPAAKLFHNTIGILAGQDYNELNYWHQALTDQLNSGVRSFELDVSKQVIDGDEHILCVHSRLFDTNSVTPLIDHALEELKIWSDNNPNHMPITILIEAKNEYMWYSSLQPFDEPMLEVLEEKISDIIDDSLYTPREMLGENKDFIELRLKNDYPLIDEMRGKFVFVLHRGPLDKAYSTISIENRKLFLCISNVEDKNALFVIHNNSNKDGFMKDMEKSLSENLLIRTRIDEFPLIDEDRKIAAFNSGANILSTDYVPRLDTSDQHKYEYHENTFDGYTISIMTKASIFTSYTDTRP